MLLKVKNYRYSKKRFNMKGKNIYYLSLLLLVLMSSLTVSAQQDPMYTQYMYNTLSVNPAYAGSRGALSLTGLVRKQWVGIDGAPSTQTLTMHSPVFSDNMGLGLSVINDQVGPIHQTMLFADYSYSIQTTDNAKLAFGLNAGINILEANLAGLQSTQAGDLAIYDSNKLLPNVGVGVYYYSQKGYVGLSAPKLLEQELMEYKEGEVTQNKERRHYFMIAGYVFDLSSDLKFKPSVLVKAVPGAPLSIDLSGNFFIREKLGIGLAHRLDDSFSVLLQYYITPQFRVGYAYDLTTTELKDYNSGSHELMLGYDFNFIDNTRIYSPRFF